MVDGTYAPGMPLLKKVSPMPSQKSNVRCQIIEVMGSGTGLNEALRDIVQNLRIAGREVHAIDVLKIHAIPLTDVSFKLTINAKVALED